MKNASLKINIILLSIVLVALLALSGCNTVNQPASNESKLITNQTQETQQNGGGMPPNEAIAACKGKAVGDTCQFTDRNGNSSGLCDDKPGMLACAPNRQGDNGQAPSKPASQNKTAQTSTTQSTLSAAAESCISHTKDNPQCKDCCDCLSGADGATRTQCRDTCATHDFSQNSNFITVTAPSVLGPNGDYSTCVAKSSSAECKVCCEGSSGTQGELGLQCGDLQYCRTACNKKFGDLKNETAQPPNQNMNAPDNKGSNGGSSYTIEQAISDKAQLNTLAFGGLGFLTGNLCSDSFLPPGKVADFFGFQHLRDITANGKGHDTDFVTNSANNVLYILNDAQKAKLTALAKSQGASVNQFAYMRYPLMQAFRRQLTGDIPSGTTGLSKSAVMSYSSDLYELDANISIERARLYADILNSLDSTQKAYLDAMVSGGFASWTVLPDQVDKKTLTVSQSVLVMTYASEMFGWYAGDVEADTYFCPERQADYFGGFYIKDAPAIGNAGYTIDESITGDAGDAFITTLDSTQKPIVTSLVDTQRVDINGIVDTRRAISTELRKLRASETIDESAIRTLAREYGALDGEISYYYATAFSKVGETLTAAQKAKMIQIKNLGNYTCPDTNIYLYSEKINKPAIENTDFLFE